MTGIGHSMLFSYNARIIECSPSEVYTLQSRITSCHGLRGSAITGSIVFNVLDVITCGKFQNEIFRGCDFTWVEFTVFLLICEWALRQCSAMHNCKAHSEINRRMENHEIEKLPYRRNDAIDFNQIWHGDALRPFWSPDRWKLGILKNQDRFRRNLTGWRSFALLSVPTVKISKI